MAYTERALGPTRRERGSFVWLGAGWLLFVAETALHVAVKEGNEEAVQVLIEKHFNVNAKDAAGCTPL